MKNITEIKINNFKQHTKLNLQFKNQLTILAGGNNSGKSSLLQALSVWEFCKTVLLSERGPKSILPEEIGKQGIGIDYNNFTAINIPSFKHLWTGLKTTRNSDEFVKGYTLTIEVFWNDSSICIDKETSQKRLKFGLSLANNTLFVKLLDSNLEEFDEPLRIVYLPTISGVSAHEEKINTPARRRKIGEGLAGNVLRNVLFDHYLQYQNKKQELLNPETKKLSRPNQRELNNQSWAKIQELVKSIFGIELVVEDFIEDYHSFIEIKIHDLQSKSRSKKIQRDIMFEGSGFLQWLAVFAFVYSKDTDVLLLDEPDSHLHPLLQKILISTVDTVSSKEEKSVFISSHSPEILKSVPLNNILYLNPSDSRNKVKYINTEEQRRSLLEGIGTSYFQRLYNIGENQKIIFHEGKSDKFVLEKFALAMEIPLDNWFFWQTTDSHEERFKLFKILKSDFQSLVAVSIRDRDDQPVETIDPSTLIPKGDSKWDSNSSNYVTDFLPQTYLRKELESYLIHPTFIVKATRKFSRELLDTPQDERESKKLDLVKTYLSEEHSLTISDNFFTTKSSTTILELEGKKILDDLDALNYKKLLTDVTEEYVPQDFRNLLINIENLENNQLI